MKNFEEFLEQEHSNQYVGFDDDMPDNLNEWIAELEVHEWVKYGDEYASFEKQKGYDEGYFDGEEKGYDGGREAGYLKGYDDGCFDLDTA